MELRVASESAARLIARIDAYETDSAADRLTAANQGGFNPARVRVELGLTCAAQQWKRRLPFERELGCNASR